MQVRIDQAGPRDLEAVRGDGEEPVKQRVPESRVRVASGPHGRRVELERLQWLGGYGAELELTRGSQPRQAEHVAAAQLLDNHPAGAGHKRVKRNLAGVDQPERPGRCAFVKQSRASRHANVPSASGKPLDLAGL